MHSVLAIAQLIWTFLPLCARGELATLTTAVPWHDDVSVKPTPLLKRIAVDVNVGELSRVSPDTFRRMGHVNLRSRNHDDDIWNWDYWCHLQPQKGNCTNKYSRYYYNSQLDQCVTFSYSGCSGNRNNFETLTQCDRHCKGAAISPTKHVDRNTYCSLQPNAGQCVALFEKYYYDVNERTCKVFNYGGCGGNRNRFTTQLKCLQKCQNAVKQS